MNRYKIVMLPTDEASNIVLCEGKHLFYSSTRQLPRELVSSQHLYIVDTEATIEVGDWYIDLPEKKLIKSKFGKHQTQYMGYDVKVTASTNTSLDLPAIPQHLIEGVIEHGVDNIVIEDCYYAGDVFTIRWTEKLTQ